jgi:peptidoglycan/LPS O-acetylase OafA/YrhL
MAFMGISRGDTLGSVLDRHKGIGPGFDLLRVLLALAIVYYHTFQISGSHGGFFASFSGGSTHIMRIPHVSGSHIMTTGQAGFVGISRPFHVALLPAFFALSGFLVIGSAFRLRRVSTFLAFRFFRIFPASVVEVCLSALILGPIFTKLSLAEYFSSPIFFRYFSNTIGFITFELPGVFDSNPWQSIVNANLWTLPSEFDCYFITAILMASGLILNRKKFTIIYLMIWAVASFLNLFMGFAQSSGNLPPIAITFYFFSGVCLYHWRSAIPVNPVLGIVSAVIVGLGLSTNKCHFFVAPFLTYLVALFGVLMWPKIKLLASGDYSYGIYLYAFPIGQATLALFPFFEGRGALLTLSTLLTASLFSAFSWHMIEKPALRLKRRLPARWFPIATRPIPQTPEGRSEIDAFA